MAQSEAPTDEERPAVIARLALTTLAAVMTPIVLIGIALLLPYIKQALRRPAAAPAGEPPVWTRTAGRHRLGDVANPYRPRVAPPYVPGPGPLTDEETRARMLPVPIAAPGHRDADTAVIVAPDETVEMWFGARSEPTRELATL